MRFFGAPLGLAVPLLLVACGSPPAPIEQPVERPEPAEAEPAEPEAPPSAECTTDADCGACYFAVPPASPSDCQCSTCAHDILSRRRCDEIVQSWQRTCETWVREHDCPPVSCAPATERARCREGRCVGEPI